MPEGLEPTSVTRVPVEAFTGQCQRHLTPVTDQVSCFESLALDDDQRRQMLREPIEAIPRALLERLPPLRVVLVPYLERGAQGGTDTVCFAKPPAQRQVTYSVFDVREEIFLLFGVEEQDVTDFHYWLFHTLARLAASVMREEERNLFTTLVMDELKRGTRGEVDDRSLQSKAKVLRRHPVPGRNTKLMREYTLHALEDTLTLYLHGLACDIEVDASPRQLGSRYLRARLEALAEIFPPNEGYQVFPDPNAGAAGSGERPLGKH
jgi:hypothetical protein